MGESSQLRSCLVLARLPGWPRRFLIAEKLRNVPGAFRRMEARFAKDFSDFPANGSSRSPQRNPRLDRLRLPPNLQASGTRDAQSHEQFDLGKFGLNSTRALHVQIEAQKLPMPMSFATSAIPGNQNHHRHRSIEDQIMRMRLGKLSAWQRIVRQFA